MFSPGRPFRGRPQLRAPPPLSRAEKYLAPSVFVVAVTGLGVWAGSSLPRPSPRCCCG